MPISEKPVLYSFRRCPYAIRARLALNYSRVQVELREVILRDKPQELIAISNKATVPVLVLNPGQVIDESLDIMHWALQQRDPDNWRYSGLQETDKQVDILIKENDSDFKFWLDRYKYADRYPESSKAEYYKQCERFLIKLEQHLIEGSFLYNDHFGLADAAIAPFIRQLSLVDKRWFAESPYPKVKRWLNTFLQSPLFTSVMEKYPQWHSGDQVTFFPKTLGGVLN